MSLPAALVTSASWQLLSSSVGDHGLDDGPLRHPVPPHVEEVEGAAAHVGAHRGEVHVRNAALLAEGPGGRG